MKRKIRAVLMADIGAPKSSGAADDASSARLDTYRAVIRDVVAHGGGEMLAAGGANALVAAFQSAVAVMRAAVDMQETLRARNKALTLAERVDVRIGIAIAEVPAEKGEVPAETLAAVRTLVDLAAPGGLCVSQSLREAVAGKLHLAFQPVTPDGAVLDGLAPATYRVAVEQAAPARRVWTWPSLPVAPKHAAAAAATLMVGALAWLALTRSDPSPAPGAVVPTETAIALPLPVPADLTSPAAANGGAAARPGGTLVFKPAHAPDPSAVLSAKKMLPNAWRDCERGQPDTAVEGCQLLIDSGLAQGAELADLHLRQGKALRDRGDFDRALASMTAALSIAPTPAVYALRGTVQYKKQNWDAAIADYSEAIRRDARHGEALNNRAWTYYRMGRTREALPDADAAVRLLAKEAYAWDTRAHIHAALGNRDAAIRDFRAALAIDPAYADSKAGLAKLGVN